MELQESLVLELEELRSRQLHRVLRPPSGIDLTSNDYLGLSRHPAVRQALLDGLSHGEPCGSGGSRLLRGHRPSFDVLEARLAKFSGSQAALVFSNGYAANLGLLSALLKPEDAVFSDASNHASLIDGIRLSGARRFVYPHLDLTALKAALRDGPSASGGRRWIVTESLFSMDGDIAPLSDLVALASQSGAVLIVDEAHAVGLYGKEGSGLCEEVGVRDQVAAVVGTFGKALGLFGAYVGTTSTAAEYLVHRARSFVFTTALPPFLLAGVQAALDVVAGEPGRRGRVLELADGLRRRLGELGLNTGSSSQSPIVPVILGESERALAVASALQAQGYDVRAIRPPTVPEGTARLRVSVHADHDPRMLEEFARAVHRAQAVDRVHGETS